MRLVFVYKTYCAFLKRTPREKMHIFLSYLNKMFENIDWSEFACVVLNTFMFFTFLEMISSILKQITLQESEDITNNERKNRSEVIICPDESSSPVYVIRVGSEEAVHWQT